MDDKPPIDVSACDAGFVARRRDDEESTLTDNPYTEGTPGNYWWYRGYNFEEEDPETLQLIRQLPSYYPLKHGSTHITPTPEV